jgi:hypothetical protein
VSNRGNCQEWKRATIRVWEKETQLYPTTKAFCDQLLSFKSPCGESYLRRDAKERRICMFCGKGCRKSEESCGIVCYKRDKSVRSNSKSMSPDKGSNLGHNLGETVPSPSFISYQFLTVFCREEGMITWYLSFMTPNDT